MAYKPKNSILISGMMARSMRKLGLPKYRKQRSDAGTKRGKRR